MNMNSVIAMFRPMFQRWRAMAHYATEGEGDSCPLMLQLWTWLAGAFAFFVLAALTRFNG